MSSTGVDEEAFDPDVIQDVICDHMYMGRVYIADDIVMATLKKDGNVVMKFIAVVVEIT